MTASIGTATLFRACRWRILLNAEGAVNVATAFRYGRRILRQQLPACATEGSFARS
jgi:hypothetical protein